VLRPAVLILLVLALGAAPAGAQLLPLPTPTPPYPTVTPVPTLTPTPTPTPTPPPGETGTAFDGDGMWIWYVSQSSGGTVTSISQQALGSDVGTVFVKSGDGVTPWSQFNSGLVNSLKDAGLRVCAWQFVYGERPVREANVAALAVKQGADCLVIDAESHYEGRYAAAQKYMRRLRARVGEEYPLGLSSFPYVDYHPGLPYSVFLGPGNAQVNLPQIYWKAIGGGVDAVVEHTYLTNLPYESAIAPIGQLYQDPPVRQIKRFRKLVAAAGAPGVSWWVWQHANNREWNAVTAGVGEPLEPLVPELVTLTSKSRGDLVVWAQMHLNGAGRRVRVTGRMNRATRRAVEDVQLDSGLPVTGVVDTATWQVLLAYEPVAVDWVRRARPATASVSGRDELR
jgi:hypothetical protein